MARLAALTQAQKRTVASLIIRAEGRFNAAENAAHRTDAASGDYDNGFDGVVTGIYHLLDAFELARSAVHRSIGEADAPTIMASVVASLSAERIPAPSVIELRTLNRARNTSVHGGVLESPFGTSDVEDAVEIARFLAAAIRRYLNDSGLDV